MMFLDLKQKQRDRVAAIDSVGKSVTYGDIIRYSVEFRRIVVERTLVLILCKNDTATLQAYLACMINRIVSLLISEKTETSAVKNLIDLYHPKFVIGCRTVLQKLSFCDFTELENDSDFYLASTSCDPYPLYPELSLLLTTSGSTGSPKLVRHSYDNLQNQAKNIAAFFEMDGTERPMIDLPIMYTYGLSIVNSHLYAGATILLCEESILSKSFWDFFKEQKATSFTGVPYSFEVLKRIHFFQMDLPSLTMISQGGGKLSRELQKEFAEYIIGRGGRYIATYGQTECSARMAYLPSELAIEKCGSIGKAIPNGKLYLKNSDGSVISSANVEGEMYYEGPNVTLGYAQNGTDLIKGDERHGVIATGDIAYTDEDGYFYISGRKKRFLKLYGYRVNLDECENIIKNAFQIECACTGTDQVLYACIVDPEYAEKVKMLLIGKTSLYPAAIEVKTINAIPRNGAGKTLYSELDAMIS